MNKVISGGQSGCDQAALRAAKASSIETGGWMHNGFLTEYGPRPDLAELYGLKEHTGGYAERNAQNVEDADGTLILYVGAITGGTLLTANLCRKKGGSRWIAVDLDRITLPNGITPLFVASAIRKYDTLNVAGPRESKIPGIGARAEAFLREVFAAYKKG